MKPSLLGTLYIALIGVALPWLAIRNALRVRKARHLPTRRQHLFSVAFTQGLLLVLALTTARREWIDLFPPPTFPLPAVLAALGLTVLALATLPLRWSWRTPEEKRRVLWMLPSRTSDLWWWLLVALTAGIVEEIAYRGVLFTLLARLTGSWWVASIACVIAFGLVHFVQGARTVVIIAVLSLGIHAIVRLSGNLYTAMALHFVYDLLAGAVLLHLARRDGLLAESGEVSP